MNPRHIEIVADPPARLLRHACSTILVDEHYASAWSDATSRIFADWMQRFDNREYIPFLWLVEGEIAGLQWAHDFGEEPGHAYTWLGGSAFRPARGQGMARIRQECVKRVEAELEDRGYHHIFGACLLRNQAAYNWIVNTCAWHPMGIYRDMLANQGKLTDYWLFTRYPEDRALIWVAAEKRAEKTRQLYRQH